MASASSAQPLVLPGPEPAPVWVLQIVTVGADGSADGSIRSLSVSPDLSSCAEWSPQGSGLAYLSVDELGGHRMRVLTVDGEESSLGPAVALLDDVNHRTQAGAFEWAPDGSGIALVGADGLWLLGLDGQDRRVAGGGFRSVAWSPTGDALAVGRQGAIRLLSPDGSALAEHPVDTPGEAAPAFAWSPDGRSIAYSEGRDVVFVDARTGSVERRTGVLDGLVPDGLDPFVLGWAPDGRAVLVGSGGVDTPGSFASVPLEPGSPASLLVGPTFALRGIGVSWQAIER
jgi:Tol biopolymer transport system component